MSSSTFTQQRWTSVDDLTTKDNNNKNMTSFFLQASLLSDSNTFTFTSRPSQSLVSLVKPSSSSSSSPSPSSGFHDNGRSEQTKPISSRVANIIHQFEAHSLSSMNHKPSKLSPPARISVKKLFEGNSSQNSPVVIAADVETSSTCIPFNSKKANKPQPIIVYETVAHNDRSHNPESNSPVITPDNSSRKISSQNLTMSQQNIESDTDSAIHTMPAVMKNDTNYSATISRSSTTDSTCSSLSLSDSSSRPHFDLSTSFSAKKQHDLDLNLRYSQQGCSLSPSPARRTTFTKIIPSAVTYEDNENLQSSKLHSLTTRFCSSELNIADQYRQFLSSDTIQSDLNLSENSTKKFFVNTNFPLKYKRDSFIRLYGPDALLEHGPHTSHDVVLEEDIDPPFKPRIVTVQKNKSVTDQYELLEFLGRGKFGEVKKCRERSTKHLLAAKFLQINRETDRTEAFNEIEIMKALQHPRLLQLYDAFETKSDICLIMELITGGELFERVIDEDFILTERLCELYMMQICEGVNFMHSCNIIHLDMKPENVLCLNRDGHRIKIIDFGLARKFDPDKQLKVLFGTPEFVAPEVINFDRIGFGTDMWSVGVICYVLLSGLSPFMGENDNDTYTNINRVNFDFDDEAFTDISDEAKDFISKLLLKNKDERLLAKDCLAHPWLTRRPKLASTPSDEETAEKKLSTKKLRRFVIRRRWQKAVNALLALKRMGMTL
ncbi:unnamed protein product [Rotaria socialis]|uniref:Protein kinase domain-containing protein n=7 Tax=Rotaria socialis TaxID=392032 RepID=A0A818ITI0_9BILA|nr:unnamed protein product [Rotaria socialis]CAF4487787.1 unnamed protein product [Rotaria socialis]